MQILLVIVGAGLAYVVWRSGGFGAVAGAPAASTEQTIYQRSPLDKTIDLATLMMFVMLALVAVKGLKEVKSIAS